MTKITYHAPDAAFRGKKYNASDLNLVPEENVTVGGKAIPIADPPDGIVFRDDLGILVHKSVPVQRIQAWPEPYGYDEAPRGVITDAGDYLVLFAAGAGHQWAKTTKVNDIFACRSADQGRTWTIPELAWESPYNQHAANLFKPAGQRRIYAFQMEAIWDEIDHPHAAPLGMRWSDDDGDTWLGPEIIRPENDSDFKGVCHMQMDETDEGTWLLPTYTPISDEERIRRDRQYVLRSTDQGKSWELIPGPRPSGWTVLNSNRLMEGEIVVVDGKRAVLYTRESSGCLWEQWSDDDGRTWTDPKPTPGLVHPDAPPMVYKAGDGKTLVNFTHNRKASDRYRNAGRNDRQELWVSISRDSGKSWSESRFVASNACPRERPTFRELSYADLIADGDDLHLFLDEDKRQILHFHLKLSEINKLPTESQLADT